METIDEATKCISDFCIDQGFSQLLISGFTTAGLFFIHWNISRRLKPGDNGILYLALATLSWIVAGLWASIGKEYGLLKSHHSLYHSVRVGLSILNNVFFCLSIFHLDHPRLNHLKDKIRRYDPRFIKSQALLYSISLIIIVVSAFGFWRIELYCDPIEGEGYMLDLISSVIVLFLMMAAYFMVFLDRKLYIMAFLSVIAFIFIIVAQFANAGLIDALKDPEDKYYMLIFSKTCLSSIFFVLATSWVFKVYTTPSPDEMKLELTTLKDNMGRNKSLALRLHFPPFIEDDLMLIPDRFVRSFRLLLKYAIIRKKNLNNGYFSLKDGDRDLKDSNSDRRDLMHMINSKLSDEQNLSFEDLFYVRNIQGRKLKVHPENILIDKEGILAYDPDNFDTAFKEYKL